MATMDADRFVESLRTTAGPLHALYVLTGDEPLLVAEAGDALRAAGLRLGYTERKTVVMDARSDWSAVLAETQSVSLFGDKRVIEIKLPGGKPGKTGGETLIRLAQQAAASHDPDVMLVVHLPRLDRATRDSKWAAALLQAGTVVDIAPVERGRLAAWIGARLAKQDQRTDRDTLQWMADKVEGNLLAAHQEIQKLGLLYPQGTIAAEDIERAVLNVARYDVFGLRDAMLAGDAARTVRMLEGLKAEGEALPLVLWAVGEEVRVLARIAEARQSGQDMAAVMRRLRVFGNHERLAMQAIARAPAAQWPAAVQHAHDVDRLIKGLKVAGRLDDPWEEMMRLALRVAVGSPRPARKP